MEPEVRKLLEILEGKGNINPTPSWADEVIPVVTVRIGDELVRCQQTAKGLIVNIRDLKRIGLYQEGYFNTSNHSYDWIYLEDLVNRTHLNVDRMISEEFQETKDFYKALITNFALSLKELVK